MRHGKLTNHFYFATVRKTNSHRFNFKEEKEKKRKKKERKKEKKEEKRKKKGRKMIVFDNHIMLTY